MPSQILCFVGPPTLVDTNAGLIINEATLLANGRLSSSWMVPRHDSIRSRIIIHYLGDRGYKKRRL